MKRTFLVIAFSLFIMKAFCQGFNNNTNKTYLNIALPKTPESQSFEKYGNIPVNEFTGTVNIAIPLYTAKSRFLEVPLTLSYHASGIKVSQEATWVGLGFDLIDGGRITVETKGNVDDNVKGYTNAVPFKTGLRRIFNRFGTSHHTALLGYAFLDYHKIYGAPYPAGSHAGDTAYDDDYTVSNAAWSGIGEPDIYHANFLGNSVSFYFDLVTNQIKFIGEKSLFAIEAQRDALERIEKFQITDNNGVKFFFEQKEKTRVTSPPFQGAFAAYESTTAWLLTKMLHPTGDSILFTYSGFGKIYPAFNLSASISIIWPNTGFSRSSDHPQNQVEQEPYYLTKIETNNAIIDFSLSGRQDIRGPGARKLDTIKVIDKQTDTVIKNILFKYNYFASSEEAYEQTLPDSISQYYRKRLMLLSVKTENSPSSPLHYFYYNPGMGTPSKLSFSQDHWGYFNAAYNAFYADHGSPQNLIPRFDEIGALATRNIGPSLLSCLINGGLQPDGSSIVSSFDGYASGRYCSPLMATMMMDSIVYPTGGSTKFVYEPHFSYYQHKGIVGLKGGGLRIKEIRNYSFSPQQLANKTEYKYEETDGGRTSGIYLGAIEYIKISNKAQLGHSITLSSSGDLNSDNLTVGYTRVKKIIKDEHDQSNNGYVVKYYHIGHPFQVEYKFASEPYYNGPFDPAGVKYLLKQWANIAPTPRRQFDGKLMKDETYNSNNNIVKSTAYYYRQADYSQQFYSLKAEDNYSGGSGQILSGTSDVGYGCDNGNNWRRWSICASPAKSFFTVLDSVIEKTYTGSSNYITQKKAYTYNNYYQQEYEITYNADGTQTMNYSRTPLSFATPQLPASASGNALSIENLKQNHIYDVPVEEISITRTSAGDSLVNNGRFNIYQGVVLKNSYALESDNPLQLTSQFAPSYYEFSVGSAYDVKFDNRYKLHESADYTSDFLIKDLATTNSREAFIWDETYNTVLAQCTNAVSGNIAYTSFETAASGNWTYTGAPLTDLTAPTGKKAYSINNGSISKTGLNSDTIYVISYWSKNTNAFTIAGTQTGYPISGHAINGWKYFEHRISGQTSVTINGSGFVDELRLYPAKSQMITYTYEPFIGISSQCDVNNRIVYYEYDEIKRLQHIRDDNKNIVKKFSYSYLGQPYSSSVFYNDKRSVTISRNNCSTCDYGTTVTYAVPEGKFSSTISQADVEQKVTNDIDVNGQAFANANGQCLPYFECPLMPATNWLVHHNQIYYVGSTVTASFVVYPINNYYNSGWNGYISVGNLTCFCRPSATRYVTATESGRVWEVAFYPSGNVQIKLISGPLPTGPTGAIMLMNMTYNM